MAGFETYDTPNKLRGLLTSLLEKRALPIHKGKIARKIIEKEFGFQHNSLSNYNKLKKYEWVKSTIDSFESELLENEGEIAGINLEFGTPKRLNQLLDSLRQSPREIPLNPQGDKAGSISLRAFAKKFNLPESALLGNTDSWLWMRKMVKEFDDELYGKGIIGTRWEKEVPAIRQYLESLKHLRKLPVNELGKLNRMAVMSHFGLPKNQSTAIAEQRAPKLKKLFSEYDCIIQSENYSQYSGDVYLEDLKLLLDCNDESLVLDLSSRVISIKWLADKLNIGVGKIRSSLVLMSQIEQRTRELHLSQKKGKTKKSFNVFGAPHINLGATPFSVKHKRVYSFQSLVNLYGLCFAEKIGTAFIAISNSCATSSAKNKYLNIKRFFEWLADTSNIESEVFELLKSDKKISQQLFGEVCMRYRASILQENPKCNPNLKIISEFGSARVLPKYIFLTKGRTSRNDRNHKASLAEATVKKKDKDLIEKVLFDAAKYRDIEIRAGNDTQAFLNTLLLEKATTPDLPEDLTEAIHEITQSRLLEIRVVASRMFREWKDIFEQGPELIRAANVDTKEFAKKLAQRASNLRSWKDYLSNVLPQNNKDKTLSNLLAIISSEYSCTPPNEATTGYQMWNKKYSLVGGIQHVAAHLIPTREAISAALTLYLCESGANVSVALTLTRDCVKASNVEYHKKVVGHKERSKGKAIYDDLAVKASDDELISAVSALEYLAKILNSLNAAVDSDTTSLAMYFHSGKLQLLKESAFRADFKAICDTSSYLEKFNLVPSMLRPTVLLDIQLRDPTNLGVAQLMAQHEQGSTTEGYTSKLPHRIKMENQILDYQKTLEFVMTSGEDNPHTKLNMSEKEWDSRRKSAQRTGFGVYCSDRIIIDSSGKTSKCNEVEHCVQCKHNDSKKRMWVSADPESISDMIIWRTSLEQHEEAFLSKNSDRWEDVWVAWQAFYFVVLEQKMTRGKLSSIKRAAMEIANQKMSDDNFNLPEPW